MATAAAEPVDGRDGPLAGRWLLGVALPLAVAGLSYALWWISDRLVYIGPLDRAAFGWIVVIPLWIAAPVSAGFAWRRLTAGGAVLAAVIVGAAISAVTAALLWQSLAFPNCENGAIHTPLDYALPSLGLGLVFGGGLAVSGLVAWGFVRSGRPLRGVLIGAGAEIIMVLAAILVAAIALLGPACQRPPV